MHGPLHYLGAVESLLLLKEEDVASHGDSTYSLAMSAISRSAKTKVCSWVSLTGQEKEFLRCW
jgi:hypothetical protein